MPLRRVAGNAARQLQLDVQPRVDPGVPLAGPRGNDLRCTVERRPEHPQRVQPVAADVHEPAAREVQPPARVAVVRRRHDHVDLDLAQLAQLARPEQLVQAGVQRVVGVVEPLHQRHPRRGRGVAHLPGLVRVARRRLLGEDVPARLHGGAVPRPVQRVRQRVVDDLDLGIGDQLGVRPDDALDAVPRRERLGPGPVAGGDRDEPVTRGPRGPDERELGDPGGAEDADPQWLGHRTPSLCSVGSARSLLC
jgi:hypothetical protein